MCLLGCLSNHLNHSKIWKKYISSRTQLFFWFSDEAYPLEPPLIKKQTLVRTCLIIYCNCICSFFHREELMVRLVQIEGLPVSKEFYSPNSAYVDVQLKYTGSPNNSTSQEVQRPPRLDICLQQVNSLTLYFYISILCRGAINTSEFRNLILMKYQVC